MTTTIQPTRSRGPIEPTRVRPRLARGLAALAWAAVTLLALVVVLIVSPYLTFDPEEYFAEQRENYLRREFALGVHVLSGILALLVGPWQFVAAIRRRFVRVHRLLGAVYVASALALGLSGLVFVPTAYTGIGAVAGFALLDAAMLFTTGTAVRMIVAGRYADHRRWMIRSFSLILAGVMLRLESVIYTGLASAGVVSFSFETAYAGIAWLCWVPNLLVALWITRRSPEAATGHDRIG
jgi:uncharacterized membrane protein